MATPAAAWAAYTAAVGWFATGRLPVLGASWNEFFNTLLAASFVRANVPHRTHWARAFAVTLMIAMGGSLTNGLLFGFTPGWLTNPAAFMGIVYAYLLAFHCPGDAFFRVYRHPALRPLVDVLKGMALVQSVGGTIENLAASPKLGEQLAARHAWHAFVLAGTVAGGGGLLLAEYLNLLALPVEQYWAPGPSGPGGGLMASLLNSLLYTFVLRNPAQLRHGAVWERLHAGLQALPLPRALSDLALLGVGLLATFVRLPLARDAASAQALLSLSTTALQAPWLLGPAGAQRAVNWLLSFVPGWRTVLVPGALGTPADRAADAEAALPVRPPGDCELFGYRRLPGWRAPRLIAGELSQQQLPAPHHHAHCAGCRCGESATAAAASGATPDGALQLPQSQSPSRSPPVDASLASSPRSPFRPVGPTVVGSSAASGGHARRRRSVSLSPTGQFLPARSPVASGGGTTATTGDVGLAAAATGGIPLPSMRTKAGGVVGRAAQVVPPPGSPGGKGSASKSKRR